MTGASITGNVLTYKQGTLQLTTDQTYIIIDADFVYDANNTFRYIAVTGDLRTMFDMNHLTQMIYISISQYFNLVTLINTLSGNLSNGFIINYYTTGEYFQIPS